MRQDVIAFLRANADRSVHEVLPIVVVMVSKVDRSAGEDYSKRTPMSLGRSDSPAPAMRLRRWCELSQMDRLRAIEAIAPADVVGFTRLVDGPSSRYFFDASFTVHVS